MSYKIRSFNNIVSITVPSSRTMKMLCYSVLNNTNYIKSLSKPLIA